MSTTSLPRSEAEAATIRKPLPEDLFVHHDTNAEMRWESVRPEEALTPQDRLFVRNHTETPVIDVESWSLRIHGSGLLAPEGVCAVVRRSPGVADHRADHDPRVHRQRPLVLHPPAGPAGARHPLADGRRRGGDLARRPARRGARPGRAPSRRGCRDGHRPRPVLRLRRGHRPRPGPPARSRSRRPSTTRCSSGGSTARTWPPTTASRCGWCCRAGSASPTSSGSARWRSRPPSSPRRGPPSGTA